MDKNKIVIVESLRLSNFSALYLSWQIESSREEPSGIREVVLGAASPGQEMSLFSFLPISYSPIVHVNIIINWISRSLQEVHNDSPVVSSTCGTYVATWKGGSTLESAICWGAGATR